MKRLPLTGRQVVTEEKQRRGYFVQAVPSIKIALRNYNQVWDVKLYQMINCQTLNLRVHHRNRVDRFCFSVMVNRNNAAVVSSESERHETVTLRGPQILECGNFVAFAALNLWPQNFRS
ncbi:hypothetical protein YC2023_109512 [Brassica napus]